MYMNLIMNSKLHKTPAKNGFLVKWKLNKNPKPTTGKSPIEEN